MVAKNYSIPVGKWARSLPPRFLAAHPELLDDPRALKQLFLKHGPRKMHEAQGLLICPLLGCEIKTYPGACPSHCTNTSCPNRGPGELLLPWLQNHMRIVQSLLPSHPPPLVIGGRTPRLLLITTTFAHVEQLVRLEHVAASLTGEPNIVLP